MSNLGLRPEDVFTPRAAAVNPRTYVSRPDLELRLSQALRMPKHIVIHGESGTGKTWLYKKVLGDLGYHIEVANMGLCSSLGSISDVLRANVCRELSVSEEATKSVDGGVPALAKITATKKETTHHFHDAFFQALTAVRSRAKEKPACLVFDNLEQVVLKEGLIKELSGYLLWPIAESCGYFQRR
jgi:archaellum biogenesis ATPase FlaH